MKIKQHVVITDPLAFAKGDYRRCFGLYETQMCICDEWIDCGEIELDLNVDMDDTTKTCLNKLDEEEEKAKAEFQAKMTLLSQQRNELLCLEHK